MGCYMKNSFTTGYGRGDFLSEMGFDGQNEIGIDNVAVRIECIKYVDV